MGGYQVYIGLSSIIVHVIRGYHEHIGGCLVHWKDFMRTSEDIISTLGGVQYKDGYHDSCEDIMSTLEYTGVHWRMLSTSRYPSSCGRAN